MSNKTDFLKNYITSKKELMQHFQCNDDFFIKPLESLKWAVKEDNRYTYRFIGQTIINAILL